MKVPSDTSTAMKQPFIGHVPWRNAEATHKMAATRHGPDHAAQGRM
jgi:hypothetical protein